MGSDPTATQAPAASEPASTLAPYHRCSCLRCGQDWKARNPEQRPASCPRCGSASWDKPPVRKYARRPDDPPNPNWKYRLKPIKRKCPTCGRNMTRLTVHERQEMEAKERARLAEVGERVAIEQPARPGAVKPTFTTTDDGYLFHAASRPVRSRMTPPPGLRGPTPPPPTRQQPETPEVQASRRDHATLSEELKENKNS